MTETRQRYRDYSITARPTRRLARIPREFMCEVAVDGSSVEGRTVDLNEQGIAVVLFHPLFADLDSTTLILTKADGSLVRLAGSVNRQRQISVGEVLAGYPVTPFQDRRRIPRLPFHTACTIANDEFPNRKGLTQDVSYTECSAWFSHLSPERLWGSLLQVEFVKLKVMSVGIVHRVSDTLVRFRVEHAEEGKARWRDLRYAYWQHLS